jgi:hypothetical protein
MATTRGGSASRPRSTTKVSSGSTSSESRESNRIQRANAPGSARTSYTSMAKAPVTGPRFNQADHPQSFFDAAGAAIGGAIGGVQKAVGSIFPAGKRGGLDNAMSDRSTHALDAYKRK